MERGLQAYGSKTGTYRDQSIGDTPKIYTIEHSGQPRAAIGVGFKNGGFYILDANDGTILNNTPVYTGPPTYPLNPTPDRRMLALPGILGGLQTGCAFDGQSIFTNGIDALRLGTQPTVIDSFMAPFTAGRVTCISGDSHQEQWRHERPKVHVSTQEVGDPIASGIAVANGVVYLMTTMSQQLVVLDAATGATLKQIEVGPLWSGPAVSRGHVYVGTGNVLFSSPDASLGFPYQPYGSIISFGLPDDDRRENSKDEKG